MKKQPDSVKINRLTSALNGNDVSDIVSALKDTAGLQSEQYLQLLIYKGLSYDDSNVQGTAANLLFPYVEQLLEQLKSLVNHPKDSIRYWSIRLLAQKGQMELAELKAILEKTETDDIKELAIKFLWADSNRRVEVIQILISQLEKSSFFLRRTVSQLLLDNRENTLTAIKYSFSNGDLHTKYWALKTLVDVCGDSAFDQIKRFLDSPDSTVRLYAIAALEYISNEESINILFEKLNDPSPVMRHQAFKVLLGKKKDVRKKLLDMMETSHEELTGEQMILLGRMIGREAVSLFQERLKSSDPDDRFTALKIIGQNPDEVGTQILIDAFKDPVWVIRSLASDLLSKLDSESHYALLSSLDEPEYETLFWVIKTIGATGDSNMARPLMNLFDHHPDDNVKICAVNAIARIDAAYTVELMILSFAESSLSVRNAISEALANMSRHKVLKPLVRYLFDRDRTICFWCEKTLKRFDYVGLNALIQLSVVLEGVELEAFISNLHMLTVEQIESVCHRADLKPDDFFPENFEQVMNLSDTPTKFKDINDLLYLLRNQKGSDLHINVGLPPMIRVDGNLMRTNFPSLTEDMCHSLLLSFLNENLKEKFNENWEIDFSYQLRNVGRFRANIFKQRNGISGVFRLIPENIPTYEDLGLDKKIFEPLTDNRNGLILVTGPTGSGKSTTMAVMVDSINKSRYEHILTIEDPIEFVHQHKRCSINQRELGVQTKSFAAALKSALREDPDVILVGEMRDPETIKLALTAAETGHLVFSTLHTINTYESINRIIGAFTADQQEQTRIELSGTLRAIISQKLLIRSDRRGRALAYELLICNTAVKNLIKEAKTEQIMSIMQTAQAEKMQTMDQSLVSLYAKGVCSLETIMPHLIDKNAANNVTKAAPKKKTPTPQETKTPVPAQQ